MLSVPPVMVIFLMPLALPSRSDRNPCQWQWQAGERGEEFRSVSATACDHAFCTLERASDDGGRRAHFSGGRKVETEPRRPPLLTYTIVLGFIVAPVAFHVTGLENGEVPGVRRPGAGARRGAGARNETLGTW